MKKKQTVNVDVSEQAQTDITDTKCCMKNKLSTAEHFTWNNSLLFQVYIYNLSFFAYKIVSSIYIYIDEKIVQSFWNST